MPLPRLLGSFAPHCSECEGHRSGTHRGWDAHAGQVASGGHLKSSVSTSKVKLLPTCLNTHYPPCLRHLSLWPSVQVSPLSPPQPDSGRTGTCAAPHDMLTHGGDDDGFKWPCLSTATSVPTGVRGGRQKDIPHHSSSKGPMLLQPLTGAGEVEFAAKTG